MARYSYSVHSVTQTATADTTNLVDSTYLGFIQGGSSTQRLNVSEIYIGGEAASTSSPTINVFGRSSTVGTGTAGGGFSAALDGSATAPGTLARTGNTNATVKPQRSVTLGHLLNLSFNAYGGIVRWQARPGEEISIVGNTASLGEVTLSAFTGGTIGAVSAHILYEVV